MRDYEKAAVGIGVVAIGLAAYQALKTKQATDAVVATDPSRNPIQAAADLSRNVVGNTASWFKQRYDSATGYTKGKAERVLDTMTAIPSGVSYWTTKATDFGRDATESGTKYIWGIGANVAASGKTKTEQLTNKGFTLMGSATRYVYDGARALPMRAYSFGDMVTGVGSGLEKTSGTVRSKLGGLFRRVRR